MAIIVRMDVVLAQRKIRSNELAHAIGITPANLSLLKSGKVKGIKFETIDAICEYLNCQPGDLFEHVSTADPDASDLTGHIARARHNSA